MKHLLLLIVAAILCNGAFSQTSIYVDSSIVVAGAGTTWATAFRTLGEALNVANAGTTSTKYIIHVAKGTYYPTGVQSGTNRDSSFFVGKSRITIYGGYPNGGGTPRNYLTNPTTLSGNINNATASTDNSFHVVVVSGPYVSTSDSIVIDGFNIVEGYADGSAAKANGGGMYVGSLPYKLILSSCTFSGNKASGRGGAMYINSTSPKISFCNFISNAAILSGAGGGIYAENTGTNCTVSIDHSSFRSNTTNSGVGGAFTGSAVGAVLSNDTFQNNNHTAFYYSGLLSYVLMADSCVFTSNISGGTSPGALFISGANPSTSYITNSSFTGNSGGNGGAVYANKHAEFGYCSFVNNTATNGGAINADVGPVGGGGSGAGNCTFTGNSAVNGGATYGYVYTSLCQFTANKATLHGGGAYSKSTINTCSFTNDTASVGGGAIYCDGCVLVNNVISNSIAAYGGGIGVGITGMSMERCKVYGNTATVNGGGIYIGVGAAIGYNNPIKSSLITGNKAFDKGGGIYNRVYSTTVTFTNITIAGNTATTANALYDSLNSPAILNSIVYNGINGIVNLTASVPVITYSIVQGGYTGTGNINADPMFVAPVSSSLAPTTTGNYSLLLCSPAVEAGLNPPTTALDVAGNPRLSGVNVDMGAYEYITGGTITGNSTVCINGTVQLGGVAPGGTWSSSNPSVATVNGSGLVTGVAAGTVTITYTIGSGSCTVSFTKVITVTGTIPTPGTISGNTVVCETGTSQLVSTQPNGVWSTSNASVAPVSLAGVVTGLAPGSAAITYTVTTGNCSSSTSVLFTVVAYPIVAAITGGSTVCVNSTLQLANTTPGGTWTSSAPLVATVDATGLVTAVSPGTDSIKYTLTNAGGCSKTVFKIITVNAMPTVAAITGSSVVCVGNTIQLSNATINGTWLSLYPGVATVSTSGLVTGVAPGFDTIRYVVGPSNGCNVSVYHPVTVYAVPVVPAITGPSSLCANGSLQLLNSAGGGVWTSNNTGIATVDNTGMVYGVSAGSSTITYTVSSLGGCADSATTSVQVNSVDASVAQNINELTSNQLGATYQWVSCPAYTYLTGQVSRIFTATAVGQYAVIVYFNGCVDTSACLSVTSLGVNDAGMGNTNFEVYPNPAKDRITVATGNIIPDVIRILDIAGRELQRTVPSGTTTSILLGSYPAGIYQVEVIKGHDKQTNKLSIY